jgi:hypothetical protein
VVDERERERERDKGTEEFFVHDWNEGETFGAEIRRGESGEAGRESGERRRVNSIIRFHQLGMPALSHPKFRTRGRAPYCTVPCN